MKCTRVGLTSIVFLFFTAIFLRPAQAQIDQAFEEYGVSPRDSAMGNAFAAVADTYASAFYNPAGSSQIDGTHLAIGYKFLVPKVNAKMSHFGKDRFTKYPTTQWVLLGFATDFHAPDLINPKVTDRLSMALSIAMSSYVHSYTNYYSQYTPYYFRYQDRPVSLLSAYFSFAVRITDWVSLGGGFVMAPSYAHVSARARTDVYLPEGETVSSQGIVNRAYSILSPTAGLLFRIPIANMEDRLRVGVSWRNEVRVIDGNGVALNRLVIHPPNTDLTLEPTPPQEVPVQSLSGFSPTQITLGFAARAGRGSLIATDTIWKNWSVWENYFYHRPDPPFSDTVQQRLGFEQSFFPQTEAVDSWALRAGWYYETSPVPLQNNKWNILDNHKHVMTAGTGIQIGNVIGIVKTPIGLDFGFQAHSLLEQTIRNDSDIFPEITTGGWVYTGSAAIEFTW